ncbi:MAG: hypothetical protein AAGE18_08045 [Pseudomonadota bacterium]
MTAALSILALTVTGAGLVYLWATNAKRRRVFGVPRLERRPWFWPARLAVWLPGLVLIGAGDVAALVVWLGGLTVLGWGIACLTPGRLEAAQAFAARLQAKATRQAAPILTRGTALISRARQLIPALPRRSSGSASALRVRDARIEELEARVARLEELLDAQEEARPHHPQLALARSR